MEKLFVVIFLFNFVLVTKGQSDFGEKLSGAALELTKQNVSYNPAYFSIVYPNGDVPANKGVCTYRKMNIDLQKEVHEDMKKNFSLYPDNWGLKHTDTNIDHRRVPNLMTYFSRYGKTLTQSTNNSDYKPGDIVCWDLGKGILHIGIVVNKKSNDNQRYMVVHNIENGQELSDCLFSYKIIGHYSFTR